MENTVLVLV